MDTEQPNHHGMVALKKSCSLFWEKKYISSALRAYPATVPFLSLLWSPCLLDCKSLDFYKQSYQIFDHFWGPGGQFWRPDGHFGMPGALYRRFLGWLWFLMKKGRSTTPPPVSKNTLFAVSWGSCFFECSCFWIFVILSAQTLHSGFHFDCFGGALGLSKNSWKCVYIVKFQRFDPFGTESFPRSWSWERFKAEFLQKFKILGSFGDSFFDTFETNRCKKKPS